MARAWVSRERGGRVCVHGEGTIEGRRVQRRLRVAGNDEDLAQETARQLNGRFILGDYGWLLERKKPRRPRRSRRPATLIAPTLGEWIDTWLETVRPPELSLHVWKNYQGHGRDLRRRLGSLRLTEIEVGDARAVAQQLRTEGRAEPTIKDRIGVLRMMLRDARLDGIISSSPLDAPMPRRRTKRQREQQRTRRVTFRPFEVQELDRLAEALREPRDSTERLYFPLTEFLLLTGLRFGEGAALRWPHLSVAGRRLRIERAVSRYSRPGQDEATKTAAEWEIPLRPHLAALLERQRAQSYVGRPEGWIFPNRREGPLSYHNWRHRGWVRVLERARVQPREGDAQKALRRSYITSALVCGRPPKMVAAEVGHVTLRMVTEQYDSFLDPANWPSADEIARLRAFYGWTEGQSLPRPSLESPRDTRMQKTPPS